MACAGVFACGAAWSGPSDGWKIEDWTTWRDTQIAYIFEPTTDKSGQPMLVRAKVALRCEDVYEELHPALARDPGFFKNNKDLSRFVAFVEAQRVAAKKGHSLALQVSDTAYWSYAAQSVRLPDLLSSQEFLKAMAHPNGYQRAVQMIEAENAKRAEAQKWQVLAFKGRFIKSVDRTTYGRLLVVVPNEPVDKGTRDVWVSFAIATPEMTRPPEVRSVSVVTIERSGGSSRAYLMDYLRTKRGGEIELMPTALLPDNPSKNCYECHKAAVLPVHPEVEYGFANDGRLFERQTGDLATSKRINERIRAYGKADFGPQDTVAYGPSIGQPGRVRTDEQIRTMAGTALSKESVAKIKAAMACAGCHDSFAPLNFPEPIRTDRETKSMRDKKGIAQTLVEEGLMPPGNTLTPAECRALWRCLSLEYLDLEAGSGALIEWLRGEG